MAGSIGRNWLMEGLWSSGLERLEHLLHTETGRRPGLIRARLLSAAGRLELLQRGYPRCEVYLKEACDLYLALQDIQELSLTLNDLGLLEEKRGDIESAVVYHRRALALQEEHPLGSGALLSLTSLGGLNLELAHLKSAATFQQRALTLQEQLGDLSGVARTLSDLGNVALQRGDLAAAERFESEGPEAGTRLLQRAGVGMKRAESRSQPRFYPGKFSRCDANLRFPPRLGG